MKHSNCIMLATVERPPEMLLWTWISVGSEPVLLCMPPLQLVAMKSWKLEQSAQMSSSTCLAMTSSTCLAMALDARGQPQVQLLQAVGHVRIYIPYHTYIYQTKLQSSTAPTYAALQGHLLSQCPPWSPVSLNSGA